VVGNFTLLRKRALMGDALSHATLPGVGLAFVLLVYRNRRSIALDALSEMKG
jgi:manganese/zinc/iron transport system permease protein